MIEMRCDYIHKLKTIHDKIAMQITLFVDGCVRAVCARAYVHVYGVVQMCWLRFYHFIWSCLSMPAQSNLAIWDLCHRKNVCNVYNLCAHAASQSALT